MISAGLHNIPADEYHADPCSAPSLSNSIAKILISQSPLHAWYQHRRLNPNFEVEESTRFDIGTAAHMLVMESRRDTITVVYADAWTTKAAKEARANARANGQTPVLAHQYERMLGMETGLKAFLPTTELGDILATGLNERTVIWQEDGAWCRCRPDLLSADGKIVIDYKTTENAEPEAFIRQIGRMSYDLQAEFYLRGVRTIAEDYEPTFVFLAQEISPPYACSLVSLSNAYRAIGQQKVERALGLWKQCTATNKWPSYSTRIAYAEPRPWDVTQMEESATTTADEESES